MAKSNPPDLKESLSKIAAKMAERLSQDVQSGNIVTEGGPSWVESFKALAGWYKTINGINENETEGEGIRGIAAKLGTRKPARSGRRTEATDSASTSGSDTAPSLGAATTDTLERIRQLTSQNERSNLGRPTGRGAAGRSSGAPVLIAAGRGHSVGMGHQRPDDSEDDSDGDV